MKRIGIVTLYKDNYGSELQCYATKHYLELLGYHCDVLDEQFLGIDKLFHKLDGWRDTLWKTIRYQDYWTNRKEMKKASRAAKTSLSEASQRELDFFAYTVLQPRQVDHRVLYDDSFRDEYSFFICGSDQIWNGANRISGLRFLEFANDEQKVALSPSFGAREVKSYNIQKFRKEISKFRFLSAREDSGVEIIRNLTGKNAQRLPDPVTVLAPEEWKEFAQNSIILDYPYLFMHFLDEVSDETIASVNEYAADNNLKIVCFAYPRENYKDLKNWIFVDGSPQDYVGLISRADYICTDSFHTTYFSIIFERQFITFSRNYCHKNSQAARIETLLNLYDAKEHYVNSSSQHIIKNGYITSQFSVILNSERNAIREYINKVLVNYEKSENNIVPGLKDIHDCVGCMACVDICPKNAISTRYSGFGFIIPHIDTDKCIHCKICENVCNASICRNKENPLAAIAFSKDKKIQFTSASGGVFSALSQSVLLDGGVVAGAELQIKDGAPVCNHIFVESLTELKRIQGSKYVESNMTGVYRKIEDYLKAGRILLFGGTSCQVNALYNYLDLRRINTENLFTVDLICHGVPGIKLFSDYIEFLEKRYNSDILSFSFRKKENDRINYKEQIQFANQKPFVEQIAMGESPYYRLFMHRESYRDQCYHCDFARIDKPADITIGDYFEAREDYPELFSESKNEITSNYINAMIVHTAKGKRLVDKCKEVLYVRPVDARIVQLSHDQLCVPSNHSFFRIRAYKTYMEGGISRLSRIVISERKKRQFLDWCKTAVKKGEKSV